MTGVIATIPRIQFFDPNGMPLAGGKLYTYIAGSTTPADTFEDQALSAKNENPVPLDATGSCAIWLDPNKSYKFVLKNSTGVTQPGWPIDNVSGASNLIALQPTLDQYAKLEALAEYDGPSLIGFLQDGVGAVLGTVLDELRSRFRVEQFGGKGDGLFDNTAAILRAVAALPSGGTIDFGPFVYVAKNFAVSTAGICLRGAGVNATTLKLADGQNSSFIAFLDVDGGEVANLTIDGNRANNPTGTDKVALIGARCRNVAFHDFHITGFNGKGVGFDGGAAGSETRDNRIDSFSITNCAEQAVIIDGSSGTNERVTISNFAIYDTGHAGIAVNDGANNVTISNGVMELNNSVWDCVALRNVKRVAVSGVIGEAGRNGLYVQYNTAACEDISVSNCQFIGNQQNGVLNLSGTRVTLVNVTAKNNNKGNVGASGFNVSKGTGGPEASYTTMIGCNSIDDQTTPTQTYGYTFSASPTKTLMSGCNAFGNVSGPINIPGTVAVGEMMILPGAGLDMRDMLKWTVTSAYGNLIEFWRSGDTNARFSIDQNGKAQWGAGGAAAPDVNLYRAGTNLLKTDDKLMALGGIAVGLSAAGVSAHVGTPSGNTNYMLAVYNAADNSFLGYSPLYANPW